MNNNKKHKVQIVKEILEKIKSSKSVVAANYNQMTVKQFQELRNNLEEKNVELKVYKNRLFKIAAKEFGIDKINDSLVGPNVFAFGMKDDISPAKILNEFSKKNKILKLVSGTFEGKVLDEKGILEVASLPSLEEALSMLARQLISPIQFTGVGLNQLIEENKLEK